MTDTNDILQQEREKVDELLQIHYLTADNAAFRETDGGFAALVADGVTYDRVNFHRAFPFTDPERYISIRETDGKAREIGIIKDLAAFDAATVALIRGQLALRYFMPRILKVYSIKEEYGYAYWSVLTDKGRCTFTASAGSGSTAKPNDHQAIVKDIDENRYLIDNLSTLSARELKKIDLYL